MKDFEYEPADEPVAVPESAPALQPVDGPRLPAETWAERKNTPAWLLAAARAHAFGHAHGREVTELEFDDACAAAGAIPLR